MSEPLLGVILATASSRGSHIVFRWPNNPKLLKRYSKVKYYTESRPSHLNRTHLDDDLDPMRQKAKWDQHDEDEDDQADAHSDGAGQSDTPSSSDVEDSDGTMADEDENRSVRDRAETIASHGRSKAGAVPSTTRSKSKPRRPLAGLEECNQSVRSTDRPTGAHKDVSDAHEKAPESDTGTSKELSPEEKARREERAARAYKSYLGYDIDVLASILNPRPELAHQKFELVVDDLAFLGHPVSASKAGTWGETEDERNNNDEYLDDGNERPSRQTQQRGRSGLRKEICPCDVQDGDNPPQDGEDSTAKSAKLEPNPSAKSRSLSRTRTEESTESSTSRSLVPLTQFHLVLVLDRPDPSDALSGMDLSSWLQLFYDNIVFKMTAALFAEQSKTDYVGRETEKLLALRERCMDDGQAYAAYAAQCLGISSLARCIRDLHKSISTSSDAFLTINDRIEVHLQLPPILQEPDNLPKIVDIETELDPKDSIFMSGGGFAGLGKEGADEDGGGGTYDRLLDLAPHELSFEEWCRTTGPYLLPWKTLLLLYDQAEEVPRRGRQTPGNSSPGGMASPDGGQATDAYGFEQLTRNFTSLFRPNLYHSLNFREVADMLGWNLYEDVYPMIRHLIYYRQARVIDIPHIGHVYAISPLFDFARLGPLSHIWAQTFPDVAPLPVLLSQLSSSSRALSALFPARHQRELALDVLIWLLRREVVVKMHIRLRLIATESVKRRTAERRMERHERHRARKEKKRERAAKAEARRMKKSQSEEQQRRKAAEQAKRKKEKEEQRKAGLQEERGRSRDRERSRSADTRQQGEEAAKEGAADDCDICTADDGGEGGIQTSGLSVSRPPILAHPDSVAEAAAAAAVISGSGQVAEERRTGSRERGHHHRHHHGHHHHHHHHRHHKHQQHVNDSVGGTDSSTAATDKGPIPIATRPRFDDLKFERRPVLRSRSPSTATMVTPANPGLSVSFGNVGERSELVRRARADTTGSSSSGGGLTHAQIRSDGLSITSATSQHSRPTTPNKFGRNIPSHVRDRSIGGSGSNISSSAEGSLPRRTRRATSSAGWGGRKGVARSRSPSRARMRVKGFGVDAEVEIDEDKSNEEDDEAEIKEESELASKFNSLQLEEKKGMTKRRISAASERPDLPPPSENGGSDNEKRSSQRCCSAHSSSSPFSSSSSGEISSSDLSLSSDLSESESHLHSSALSSDVGHSRPALHRSNTPATAEGDDFSASLIVEPARASRRENDYISTMVVGKDPTTVKNFYRLLPYLNGKHSIDEIEYRVNMPRRDIRRLLNLFKDFIITFLHP